MSSFVRLRLIAENGENVMLTSSPDQNLSLQSLLQMLRQLNPGGAEVRAVEYEDDEGDLVTVTNDEEVGPPPMTHINKPKMWKIVKPEK